MMSNNQLAFLIISNSICVIGFIILGFVLIKESLNQMPTKQDAIASENALKQEIANTGARIEKKLQDAADNGLSAQEVIDDVSEDIATLKAIAPDQSTPSV